MLPYRDYLVSLSLLLICFSASVLSERVSLSSKSFSDGVDSEYHLDVFAEANLVDDVLVESGEASKQLFFDDSSYKELEGEDEYIGAEEEEEIDDIQFSFSVEELDRGELPIYRKPTSTEDSDIPPVPQVTGCRTHGQVALTYSEGPSDATAKIVRQLNNAQVRSNFFINTTWLYTQQYAMVVQNMYNAGHLIGMTYRAPKHEDGSSYTDSEIRQDVINSARMIESLIQVAPKYVRLHYSDQEDTRTENIINDLGFVLVDYNLDSMDYLHKTGPEIQNVYRKAFVHQKDTYDAKGSFISIQYDIPGSGSLAAVPYIIQTIEEEGYTAVRMDGCLNDAKPYKASADSLEYVNDKFSFNTTGYKQGQKPVAIITNSMDENNQEFYAEEEEEEEDFFESKANVSFGILVTTVFIAFSGTVVQYI